MEKIIFQGQEYKDIMYVNTTFRPSFWLRVKLLCTGTWTVQHRVYSSQEIWWPVKSEFNVTYYPFWERWRMIWHEFWNKAPEGMLEHSPDMMGPNQAERDQRHADYQKLK